MSLIPAAIRRQYTARGHGVHSPFAYMFINDVLRECRHGYTYYACEQIQRHDATAAGRRLARLVLRLVSRIPGGIGDTLIAEQHPLLDTVLSPGNLTGRRLLVICNRDHRHIKEACLRAIKDGGDGTVIIVTTGLDATAGELRRGMTRGMSFTSGTGLTVIVADSSLPLTHYNLSFG